MAKKKTNQSDKANKKEANSAESQQPEFPISPVPKDFLIVGLGASAGGLDSFKKFFEAMPPDTGMAFVIVQHLDPSHKSILSDLLRNFTSMKVLEVKDNMKVNPNTLYTIPPNKKMGILNGYLKLMEPTELRGARRTIDYFFRSLASDQKEKSVGIILSGTGTEGTIGLKAIKGEGGLAIVQEPTSAKYDGMPRSVIAANSADIILPVEKMPKHLIKYTKKRNIIPIGKENEPLPTQNLLDKIFLILRDRKGNNFSHYKVNTIKRRIDKRMAINQVRRLATYLKLLQNNPKEIDILFQELLIGVTSFFRNKEAFEALEKLVVKEIIKDKSNNDSIRIWVPGCSTGEEAYSIAILFDEEINRQNKKLNLQVFASDLDKYAIDIARTGTYSESIENDVSIRRLQKYFSHDDNIYKVKKELRDKVIFAVQNLISDPPFSKLDLISCRNLLIYLNSDAQKRVFPIFHYSLNPKGFLFLGTSETIGQFSNMFSSIDRKHKIFVRKLGLIEPRPRLDFIRPEVDITFEKSKSKKLQKTPKIKLADLIEKILLIRYAPSCVIINEKNQILYFHSDTGKYLQPTPGEAKFNILDMARLGLKADLRSSINKVRRNNKEEVRSNVNVKTNGSYTSIILKVSPIIQSGIEEELLLVIFEEMAMSGPFPIKKAIPEDEDSSQILELEHELASTKEYLKTAIEELEISNEELKSANEELQSANEELQSTNEELETSKEELQSVNEEMITVNTELQNKIFELAHAHDDMSNLLASTEIGTIFLGNELEIRRFTPSITKIINLIHSDIGRPVNHLSSNLLYDNITQVAKEVLDTLIAKVAVVPTKDGEWYHMQITPYRTTENVIDGVVMSFVDITEEKRMEEELSKVNEHLSLAIEALPAVAFTCKIDVQNNCDFVFVGNTAEQVMGFLPENFSSSNDFWLSRIRKKEKKEVVDHLNKIDLNQSLNFEYDWKCFNGRYKKFRAHIKLIDISKKERIKTIVGIWQDISAL